MSVAQQPGPRRQPDAGGALAAAGLALLAAAVLVSATLLATRRAPVTTPGADQRRAAHPPGPAARAPTGGAGARAAGAARPIPQRPARRPIVQIVERRVPVQRATPGEYSSPVPPAAPGVTPVVLGEVLGRPGGAPAAPAAIQPAAVQPAATQVLGSTSVLPGVLPRTGIELAMLLCFAALAIGTGALALRFGSRRREPLG